MHEGGEGARESSKLMGVRRGFKRAQPTHLGAHFLVLRLPHGRRAEQLLDAVERESSDRLRDVCRESAHPVEVDGGHDGPALPQNKQPLSLKLEEELAEQQRAASSRHL